MDETNHSPAQAPAATQIPTAAQIPAAAQAFAPGAARAAKESQRRGALAMRRSQRLGLTLLALAVLAWRLLLVPRGWWFPAGWWRLW